MSDINDQSSDTSSEINWPIDGSIDQHDRVVFENVADQYVKGENVTAFFTIISDIKVNPNEDQIGILRVGARNITECLVFAPVQFNPSLTSGSTRHGTATFPSSALSVSDDEFYQFCYVINKEKNLGSSIPFQLNCAIDDIDLLSNQPVRKTKSDGLIALADQDNEDVVIIHTKQMLTEDKLRQENRQLSERNHRLELQKEENAAKFNALQSHAKEQLDKAYQDMQSLVVSYRTANDELSSRKQAEEKLREELNNYRSSCNQYQHESAHHAERCVELEQEKLNLAREVNQIRSQLTVTAQLMKDQATKIVGLQQRLAESDETSKNSKQIQSALEQQLRDLRLTSEKHQLSLRGQIEAQSDKILEQKDRIDTLENEKQSLQDELDNVKLINEHLINDSTQARESIDNLQQQLARSQDQSRVGNELNRQEVEALQAELTELRANEEAHNALKASMEAIKTRCIKHQKSEVDVKRQLNVYKDHVKDLQREIDDLTERINAGADEYKSLFRKYTVLEQSKGVKTQDEPTTILTNEMPLREEEIFSLLRNTYPLPVEKKEEESIPIPSTRSSIDDVITEVQKCPVCYMPFGDNLTLDNKREHIEQHFED